MFPTSVTKAISGPSVQEVLAAEVTGAAEVVTAAEVVETAEVVPVLPQPARAAIIDRAEKATSRLFFMFNEKSFLVNAAIPRAYAFKMANPDKPRTEFQ
jgi:hypothetical protein